MSDPSVAIPKWARIAIRTVGTVNAVLGLAGTLFMVDSVYSFFHTYAGNPWMTYFRFAFVTMTLMNAAFLLVLTVAAVRFIQGRISAINPYSIAVLALVVYDYAIRVLWRTGHGIGISIAAATGIGNMGVAPFEACFLFPFLYPVATIVLLQAVRWRYSSQDALATAG